MTWSDHIYPEVAFQQQLSKIAHIPKSQKSKKSKKKVSTTSQWENHMYPETARLLNFDKLSLVSSPPAWPPSLYKHQREGVDWLLKREYSKKFRGGLLCDEPGMGKTIQMGTCMSKNPKRNTLLILPNAVIQQWADTLKKMLPQASIYIHHGKTKLLDASVLQKNPMNIVIVTIAGIQNPKLSKNKKKSKIKRVYGLKIFKGLVWDRIIMDECHYIKNKSSIRARSAINLKGVIKWEIGRAHV